MIRIVGIGDLVTDIYYNNNQIMGANGGKTFANIIVNLALQGLNTLIFGTCGNDKAGDIAIESLQDVGVDTSYIIKKDIKTRLFHIRVNLEKGIFITKKRCPYCNNKTWYTDSQVEKENIINSVLSDDIIVIDDINEVNIEIIKSFNNKIMLDIGYYQQLESLNSIKILKLMKIAIVNMNESVARYLLERYSLLNEEEIFWLFKPDLLIITKGSRGATFIYQGGVVEKLLSSKVKEVDANGAGDAFFATIIKHYIKNHFIITDKMIDQAFLDAEEITRNVVTKLGARGHAQQLYKPDFVKELCLCKSKTM